MQDPVMPGRIGFQVDFRGRAQGSKILGQKLHHRIGRVAAEQRKQACFSHRLAFRRARRPVRKAPMSGGPAPRC